MTHDVIKNQNCIESDLSEQQNVDCDLRCI